MAFTDGQTLTAAQLNAAFAQYLATGTCSAAILALLGAANGPAALSAIGAASAATVAGLVGAMVYQGAWNASTNTPTLASGVGTQGFVYKVSVAGATALNGISSWAVGDMLAFDGTTWDKFDGSGTIINLATQVTGLLSSANLSITAALPFGGFKGTGAADGTAATDLATLQQVQKGIPTQATSVAGGVNAIQVTMTPASTTWTLWEKVRWASGGANTTATPTISKDGGVTNITIVKGAGVALVAGDIGISGTIHEGVYNGTNVVLLNPVSQAVGSSLIAMSGAAINEAAASIASAATMNIGAAAANNLNVTGTTGVTAFDTVQAGTKRKLRFAGAVLLTNNNTSLIMPGAANYTTAAGDVFEFTSLGSGNWFCSDYVLASGKAIAGSSFPTLHRTVLTAGTSFTSNINHKMATIYVIGAGASGASIQSTNFAGGGSSGAVAVASVVLTPNTAYTISIGTGGTSVVASNGNNGGDTTFVNGGTTYTGKGGLGGSQSAQRAGQTATGGDLNTTGGSGQFYGISSASAAGYNGAGGDTPFGLGHGGLGLGYNANGNTGTGYGGGGAGANGTTVYASGAGANGAIIIEEWY